MVRHLPALCIPFPFHMMFSRASGKPSLSPNRVYTCCFGTLLVRACGKQAKSDTGSSKGLHFSKHMILTELTHHQMRQPRNPSDFGATIASFA